MQQVQRFGSVDGTVRFLGTILSGI